MQSRPLHLLGSTALEALRLRVVGALVAWAADWMSRPTGDLGVRVEAWHAGPDTEAFCNRIDTPAGCAWIRDEAADRRALLLAVLGETFVATDGAPGDDWVADVADQAREARDTALCEALLATPTRRLAGFPGAAVRAFASGSTLISSPRLGLAAIVDAGALLHLPPLEGPHRRALPPAVGLDRAVGRSTVRMNVPVGTVDIELQLLLGLHKGDVIRLPTRLDEALPLRIGAATAARGALGEHLGHKCLQIESNSSTP